MSRVLREYVTPFCILMFTLFLLQACTATSDSTTAADDSGYQFGDITKGAVEEATNLIVLRYRYCTEEDPAVRQATLDIIKIVAPDYPEGGICTDLATLLLEVQALRNAADATQTGDVNTSTTETEDVESSPAGN